MCENVKVQTITTFAGTGTYGFSGDNGPATSAQLNYPCDVFISSSTNGVYIADASGNRIRKIYTNGTIVTIAGTGTYGFSGDNGRATSAQLNNPISVFVTSSNEVYIADSSNQRVRKIDTNGIITTIAGTGTGGYSGNNVNSSIVME